MWRHWLVASLVVASAACSPPAAAAQVLPATVVGTWQRRDAYLVVGPTGTARLRWQTDWCGPGVPEPCDREVGDGVLLGAHAEISFDTDLRGVIVSVEPEGLFATGPIALVRLGSDLIELRQNDRTLELCRPPRDLNLCDAVLM